MFVYKNRNTGDEVQFPKRNARLDHLPNWERISQPDEDVTESPTEPPADEKTPATPEDDDSTVDGPEYDMVEAPRRNAKKTEWIDFAVSQGMDRDEADEMTRDQLAERFGEGE